MEESYWLCKCQKTEVAGSLATGKPRKSSSEVIRRDLQEWKVSKELATD